MRPSATAASTITPITRNTIIKMVLMAAMITQNPVSRTRRGASWSSSTPRPLRAPAAADHAPDDEGGYYRRGQGERRVDERLFEVVPNAADLGLLYEPVG